MTKQGPVVGDVPISKDHAQAIHFKSNSIFDCRRIPQLRLQHRSQATLNRFHLAYLGRNRALCCSKIYYTILLSRKKKIPKLRRKNHPESLYCEILLNRNPNHLQGTRFSTSRYVSSSICFAFRLFVNTRSEHLISFQVSCVRPNMDLRSKSPRQRSPE